MCGDKASRCTFDSGITIGCICCVKLILVGYELETGSVVDGIEKLQVEVTCGLLDGLHNCNLKQTTWYTKDCVNANLVESFPHVLPKGDLLGW